MGDHQPWDWGLSQKMLQAMHRLNIEMVAGLIHQQQLRIFKQRPRDEQQILFPPTETVHRGVKLRHGKSERLQHCLGSIPFAPAAFIIFAHPLPRGVE